MVGYNATYERRKGRAVGSYKELQRIVSSCNAPASLDLERRRLRRRSIDEAFGAVMCIQGSTCAGPGLAVEALGWVRESSRQNLVEDSPKKLGGISVFFSLRQTYL